MKNNNKIMASLGLIILIVAGIFTFQLYSQKNNSSYVNSVKNTEDDKSMISSLTSTEWLNNHLNDRNLVILDVRSGDTKIKFEDEHIPGAVSVSSVYFQTDYPSQTNIPYNIPPKETFESIVQKLGINKDSKIVIVYPGLIAKDIMCGTRTFWTLAYYGMDNISILDGGLGKWKRDGYKITNEVKTPVIGNFKVEKTNDAILASLDQTKNATLSKDSILLDSRMVSDYVGKTKQDFIPEFGHISGSVNYFAPLFLNADLTFKSPKQIKYEMGLLGIKDGMNIISYCNSGQFATTAWFALSEIAGFKGVSSYDGSVSEWVNKGHLPLVKDLSSK